MSSILHLRKEAEPVSEMLCHFLISDNGQSQTLKFFEFCIQKYYFENTFLDFSLPFFIVSLLSLCFPTKIMTKSLVTKFDWLAAQFHASSRKSERNLKHNLVASGIKLISFSVRTEKKPVRGSCFSRPWI